MPRALSYTPKAHERIVSALRAGSSLRDAVGFAGVEWVTFCRWLKGGRLALEHRKKTAGADPRFAALARDVDQAAHESSVALVGILRRAAEGTRDSDAKDPDGKPVKPGRPGDWRAAEFLVKFRAEAPLRREQLRKLRLEGAVLKKRLEETLPPERSEITGADGRHLVRAAPAIIKIRGFPARKYVCRGRHIRRVLLASRFLAPHFQRFSPQLPTRAEFQVPLLAL